jgi:hypothetical protein
MPEGNVFGLEVAKTKLTDAFDVDLGADIDLWTVDRGVCGLGDACTVDITTVGEDGTG